MQFAIVWPVPSCLSCIQRLYVVLEARDPPVWRLGSSSEGLRLLAVAGQFIEGHGDLPSFVGNNPIEGERRGWRMVDGRWWSGVNCWVVMFFIGREVNTQLNTVE